MIVPFALLLSHLLLHPAQESLAEMQWNDETGRVEIALRLSIADEQQLLRSQSGQTAAGVLKTPSELEKVACSVLAKRVRFGTEKEFAGKPKVETSSQRYHWIGRQTEGGHVWWFFEYAPEGGKPTHLRCTLFAAPGRRSEGVPSPASHDHAHAAPVNTFVVLPAGGTPDDESSGQAKPHSFTTTAERPVAGIKW